MPSIGPSMRSEDRVTITIGDEPTAGRSVGCDPADANHSQGHEAPDEARGRRTLRRRQGASVIPGPSKPNPSRQVENDREPPSGNMHMQHNGFRDDSRRRDDRPSDSPGRRSRRRSARATFSSSPLSAKPQWLEGSDPALELPDHGRTGHLPGRRPDRTGGLRLRPRPARHLRRPAPHHRPVPRPALQPPDHPEHRSRYARQRHTSPAPARPTRA